MNLPGRIVESQDAAELASRAAEWLVEHLSRPGRLAVCLAGGSTPRRLYELIAAEPLRSKIPWDRIHWFWGDERVVPPDDSRSNQRMAREALLDHVPAEPGQIHPVPTDRADPQACAQAYADELQAFADEAGSQGEPLFDVVLLGIGSDGHTASLFPGSPALAETSRWAIAADPGLDPRVPRVTLTYPALASSRATAFLVSGADKHAALSRISDGEALPAGRVRAAGDLVWFLDQAAIGNR